MRLLMIAWVPLVLTCVAPRASDGQSVATKAFYEAEDRLRELMARLPEAETTFSNDPEALLGLAALYERYATSPELHKRSDALYRKVIDMQPQNKAALVRFALYQVGEFISRRQRLLGDLERQRQFALANNLQKVESPVEGHELFEWLRERGDQEYVVITDFNEARSRLIEKLDGDLPGVLSALAKGKALDPNNAAYNYMEASLDLDLSNDEAALLSMEQGADKPRLESYLAQMASARQKVLQAVGFPDNYRQALEERAQGGISFIGMDKVFRMAEGFEAKRDSANARRTYQAMLKAADQLRQEPVAGASGIKRGDNALSRHIEAKARQSLARIPQGTR